MHELHASQSLVTEVRNYKVNTAGH